MIPVVLEALLSENSKFSFKQSVCELMDGKPFTIAIKSIKYKGINSVWDISERVKENYKDLQGEIKEGINKQGAR